VGAARGSEVSDRIEVAAVAAKMQMVVDDERCWNGNPL
jgi:hypothetical protein